MTFDEQAGGHRFNFEGVCDRCGISRKQFEDTGEPRCAGKKPDQPNPRGMVVDAETGEIEPARRLHVPKVQVGKLDDLMFKYYNI